MGLPTSGQIDWRTPMHKSQNMNDAIRKIADDINNRSRTRLLTYLNNPTEFSNYVREAKQMGTFQKGNKSKTMRKVASMPMEVDNLFT